MNNASWHVANKTHLGASEGAPFLALDMASGQVKFMLVFGHPDGPGVQAAGVRFRTEATAQAKQELLNGDALRQLRKVREEIARATAEAETLQHRQEDLAGRRLKLLADVDTAPDPKTVQQLEAEMTEAGARAQVFQDRADTLRRVLPDVETMARNAGRQAAQRVFHSTREKLLAERKATLERLVKKASGDLSALAELESALFAFGVGGADVIRSELETLVR